MRKLLSIIFVVATMLVCNAQETSIKDVLKGHISKNELTVHGTVRHVCFCTGRRCLIEDEKGHCLEIEFKDENKSFEQSLKGGIIKAKGLLRSKILTKKRVIHSIEHSKERKAVVKLREYNRILKWMNDNKKDTYTSFYIECVSYIKL